MEADYLRFPHKMLRSYCIKAYMQAAGYSRAVCFSCGNAARELEKAGVDVLHIGRQGELTPNKWYTQADIAHVFTGYFDATSGHLPMTCMLMLAATYKGYLGALRGTYSVPCGSGETLVCLKLAYPDVNFTAVYNLDDATRYEEGCVLNGLVKLLAKEIIFADQSDTKKGGEALSPEKETMRNG